MKALIVEDEIYNFNALRSMLLDVYPQTEIVGPVVDLAGLERAMQEQSRYDVIYCDIRLEDGICFSVFENMDVNDIVNSGISYKDLDSLFEKYTFSGIRARIEFSNWRK